MCGYLARSLWILSINCQIICQDILLYIILFATYSIANSQKYYVNNDTLYIFVKLTWYECQLYELWITETQITIKWAGMKKTPVGHWLLGEFSIAYCWGLSSVAAMFLCSKGSWEIEFRVDSVADVTIITTLLASKAWCMLNTNLQLIYFWVQHYIVYCWFYLGYFEPIF